MTNVLLTSVGRRSYLVEYFKQALKGKGKVICANMYADAAAMHAADTAVVVPASHESTYIPTILELCHKHQVKLLCSFHDLDVCVLSQHLDEFCRIGVRAVLPSAYWGRLTLDKYECGRVLGREGFSIPWTATSLSQAIGAIENDELRFPVVVKARMGFGSLGLQRCHSVDELHRAYEIVKQQMTNFEVACRAPVPDDQKVLIQQAVMGKEYCVDIVNDLKGQYICHFVCEVHAMRAGESDRATTVSPTLAGEFPRQLSALTKHPGIWEVDCMEEDGVLQIIDVNPRFAGDYPFHQLAGANIPAALVAWAEGVEPDSSWFSSATGISGYKDLVPTLSRAHVWENPVAEH